MINLRSAANAVTSGINPNISATLKRSIGYATAASGARTPSYAAPETVIIQEQALSVDDIKHLDSLNIQGTLAGFWFTGSVAAADRKTGVGGDLVLIDGVTWLVVHIMENWRRSGWCHFIARQQSDA